MWGPIIGGALGAVGSIFGANKAAQQAKAAQKANDPANIVKKFEAAGVNPLLAFQGGWSPNAGQQMAAMSTDMLVNGLAQMGDGLTEAGILRLQNTQQEQEKQRLTELVQQATMGADIGGIFSDPTTAPTRTVAATAPQRQPVPVAEPGEGVDFVDPREGVVFHGNPPAGVGVDGYNVSEIPQMRFFGRDWYGSGNFATGATMEDVVGESPIISTLYAPFVLGDMVGHTVAREDFAPRRVHTDDGRTITLREYEREQREQDDREEAEAPLALGGWEPGAPRIRQPYGYLQ